jgi:hypothetical protein
MAKNSESLTAAEKKDLQAVGWSEDNPFNVPENVSPVLKSKVIEAYKKEQGLVSPLDMPNAIESANQMARARAADDGDKAMQDYLNSADENAKKVEGAVAKPDTAKADTTKSDPTPATGAKRQGDAVNK